jgi:hypothetical protein
MSKWSMDNGVWRRWINGHSLSVGRCGIKETPWFCEVKPSTGGSTGYGFTSKNQAIEFAEKELRRYAYAILRGLKDES